MRQYPRDYARRREEIAGGSCERLPLEEALVFTRRSQASLLALDEALERLVTTGRASMAGLWKMKFFGGLSIEEIAEVLETSPRNG